MLHVNKLSASKTGKKNHQLQWSGNKYYWLLHLIQKYGLKTGFVKQGSTMLLHLPPSFTLQVDLSCATEKSSSIVTPLWIELFLISSKGNEIDSTEIYWTKKKTQHEVCNQFPDQQLDIFSQSFTTWKSNQSLIIMWLIIILGSKSHQRVGAHNTVP